MRQNKFFIQSFFLLLCLSSCGYQYRGQEDSSQAVLLQVPYIPGDVDAMLNNELVYHLTASGFATCVRSGGDFILDVEILSDEQDRIGFRYDRDNPKGHLEKNLLGVEARRSIRAKLSIRDAISGRYVVKPKEIFACVDYDYTDPGSPRDQLFAQSIPMMQFSLGQLDSKEGAYDTAARPLFRSLAQKIVTEFSCNLSEIQSQL